MLLICYCALYVDCVGHTGKAVDKELSKHEVDGHHIANSYPTQILGCYGTEIACYKNTRLLLQNEAKYEDCVQILDQTEDIVREYYKEATGEWISRITI